MLLKTSNSRDRLIGKSRLPRGKFEPSKDIFHPRTATETEAACSRCSEGLALIQGAAVDIYLPHCTSVTADEAQAQTGRSARPTILTNFLKHIMQSNPRMKINAPDLLRADRHKQCPVPGTGPGPDQGDCRLCNNNIFWFLATY